MRFIRLDQVQQFAAINVLSDPGAIAGPRFVPQCADILLHFAAADAKAVNVVLTGRYAGAFAGSVAQANSIMTSLTTGAAWTALNAHLAPTTSFANVLIRDIGIVGGGGVQIVSTNAAVPGTSSGTALPSEVAAVVTKMTALSGPQHRGRMYMPCWASTALGAGDVINAAAVTALQNWATQNVGSALAAAGYTHVLAQLARAAYTSPITGRQFPARAATSINITSLAVRDNHWDSQRRRGLK